jgi:hypothetical protein
MFYILATDIFRKIKVKINISWVFNLFFCVCVIFQITGRKEKTADY